jgi:hypothetical protein
MDVRDIAREVGVCAEVVRRKLRAKFDIKRGERNKIDVTPEQVKYLRKYFASPDRNKHVSKVYATRSYGGRAA